MPANTKKLILALFTALLVFILYGPSISLPYFWDDAPHLFLVEGASHRAIWTNSVGYTYFRPLTFSFYKVMFDWLPLGVTALPHVMMLAVHALNALLVGHLTGLLWRGNEKGGALAAIAATLLFAVFPFAALPVMHFAAVMHLFVTLTALLGAIATIWAADGARSWWALAFLAALLGPYLHEFGIMIGPLLALTFLIHMGPAARRRPLPLLALPVVSASFLAVWVRVQQAGDGTFSIGTWDELLAKATFFSQGLTYPLQPVATALIARGWWDLAAMLLIGAISLLLAAWALRQQSAWRPLLLALGWVALTMLPALAGLSFGYIITSPRLIYLPGVSGAILWGAVLAAAWSNENQRSLHRVVAVGWLLLALAVPLLYVRREVQLHVRALSPLATLRDVVAAEPDQRHLVVNAIDWLSYQDRWYPMGHDGVTVSAEYIPTDQLVAVNAGPDIAVDFMTFGDAPRALNNHYLATINERDGWTVERFSEQAAQYDRVWMTHYDEAAEQVTLRYVGGVSAENTQPPSTYLAQFDNKVYLTAADYTLDSTNRLTLTLSWWLAAPELRPDATVFRHVYDCDGSLRANESGYPIASMLRFAALPLGATVTDVRSLQLNDAADAACKTVGIGFFISDGSRLPATSQDGTPLADDLFRFEQ